jgi:DNA sulfur modification protein DndB
MTGFTTSDQEFCFSALRGVQAGRHFFTFMCPLGLTSTLFQFTDELKTPERRSQRALNKSRVPEMAKYIIENPKSYVFSAIAASVDLDATRFEAYEKSSGDVGKLYVKMAQKFLINDGQHRRAAIVEAIKMKPALAQEAISVVLFVDAGLKNSQQIFADLNRHAVRPNKSINVLFDHRDTLSSLVVDVVRSLPVFQELVDLERTQISNRSRKLFTLNSLYEGTRELLGLPRKAQLRSPEVDLAKARAYWAEIIDCFPAWTDALEGRISCKELRNNTICASGSLFVALGILGNRIMEQSPDSWKERLQGLRSIDWARKSSRWQGVAIHNGRLSKRREHVLLTEQVIAAELGCIEKPKVELTGASS